MKWIWIVLGVIAALVPVGACVGAMLPVKHVASRRARYRQPPETIWAALDGPQGWRPGFGKYELLPEREGRRVWREDIGQGKPVTFELDVSDPPRRLETRIASTGLQCCDCWGYEPRPIARSTEP